MYRTYNKWVHTTEKCIFVIEIITVQLFAIILCAVEYHQTSADNTPVMITLYNLLSFRLWR